MAPRPWPALTALLLLLWPASRAEDGSGVEPFPSLAGERMRTQRDLRGRGSPEEKARRRKIEDEMFEKRFRVVNEKSPTWNYNGSDFVVLLRMPGSGATEMTKFVDIASHGCNCDQSHCACRTEDAGQSCADMHCVQHCANSGCHKMWSHAPIADWMEIQASFLRADIPRDRVLLMTVLKSPIERVISEYLWVQQKARSDCATQESNGHRFAWDYEIPCHATISDFLNNEDVHKHAFNRQTKILAGVSDFAPTDLYDSPGDMLEVAKRHLAQMPWFGLSEHMYDSIEMLKTLAPQLGIAVDVSGDAREQGFDTAHDGTSKQTIISSMSKALIDLIREGNALDIELYKYAEALFRRRLNAVAQNSSVLVPSLGLEVEKGTTLATCVSGLCSKTPLDSYMAKRQWSDSDSTDGQPEDVQFGGPFDQDFRTARKECDVDEEALGTYDWYNRNAGCVLQYRWFQTNVYEVAGKHPYFFSTRAVYPFQQLSRGGYIVAIGDATSMGIYSAQSYLGHIEHSFNMPVVSMAFGKVGAAFFIDLHQERSQTLLGKTFRDLLRGARIVILQTMRVESERNFACQTQCNTQTCHDGTTFTEKMRSLPENDRIKALQESQKSWQANHVRLLSILSDTRRTTKPRSVIVLHFNTSSQNSYVTGEMLDEVRKKIPKASKDIQGYFVSVSVRERHRMEEIQVTDSCMSRKKSCGRRGTSSCSPSSVYGNCGCRFLDIAPHPGPALHWVAGTKIVGKLLGGTHQVILKSVVSASAKSEATDDGQNIHFFMLLTKGKATLRRRTPLVSLETACKNHPGAVFYLYVLYGAGVVLEPAFLDSISQGGCKVELLTLDYEAFFRGSPLEGFVTGQNHVLRNGRFWYSHATDLFRTIVLWRFGGWYLDTDVLVLHSLTGLSNCAAWEDPRRAIVNSAVSSFERGHTMLKSIMIHITRTYNPALWDVAGPGALTSVLQTWPHKNCNDSDCVHVLPRKTFYPVSTVDPLFRDVADHVADEFLEGAYCIHLWNKLTRKKKATSRSVFTRAYRQNCLNCSLLENY